MILPYSKCKRTNDVTTNMAIKKYKTKYVDIAKPPLQPRIDNSIIIVSIMPLILDYLDRPFQLSETSKYANINVKKYGLTLISYHSLPRKFKSSIKCYKFRRICLSENSLKPINYKHLSGIKELRLNIEKSIRDEHLQFITGIEILILPCNDKITDDGLQYIKGIHELDLRSNTNISDNGLRYLTGITKLTVHCNRITDTGLSYVKDLVYLKLFGKPPQPVYGNRFIGFGVYTEPCYNNKITDVGIQQLQNLELLGMYNYWITDNGLQHLHKAKTIFIGHNSKVTQKLLTLLPETELLFDHFTRSCRFKIDEYTYYYTVNGCTLPEV